MEKRLILAIVLSSLVLLLWSFFIPKPSPGPVSIPTTTSPVTLQETPAEETEGPSPSLVTYSTDKIKVVFDEKKAAIKEIIFKDYQSSSFYLWDGLKLDKNLNFKTGKISSDSITFIYSDEDKQITKRFIFSNYNYSIELEIEVKNLSGSTLNFNLPLILGALDFSVNQAQARYLDFTVATPDKLLHPSAHKDNVFNQLKFLGLRDRYFCAITEPPSGNYTGFIKKITAKKSIIGLDAKEFLVEPGQRLEQKFHIYLGPQELKLINAVKPGWLAIVHYGTFDFISQILLQLLGIFYRLVHNWGLAITILSLAIYFMLYPLTLKQMRSMKEMQVLQPRIEELRKAYKDNPQKLNKEIMELYREHKVNPLGGCLPLILQMPIFFALYQALMRSIALKGARFLWIKDLSEPDKLFILPISLPILGNELNILPLLMMIGMFIQQKISSGATSSVSGEQQKLMLVIFPLMFGFIFYHMPAGLVLYWFVNSTLMLIYQIKVARAK